jgi:hypothetical protein
MVFPQVPPKLVEQEGDSQLASASPPANNRVINPKINNLLFFIKALLLYDSANIERKSL